MTTFPQAERPADIAKRLLTDKEFDTWILIEVQGCSLREASYHHGISHSAVKCRIKAARAKLEKHHQTAARNTTYDLTVSRSRELKIIGALLAQRDGPYCYLCGDHLQPAQYQIEHIIPTSKGGNDDPSNLTLACGPCNSRKSNKYVSILVNNRRPVYHPDPLGEGRNGSAFTPTLHTPELSRKPGRRKAA